MKLRSIVVAGVLFSALVLARPGDADADVYFEFGPYGSGVHIGRGYYPYWYYYRPHYPYRDYYAPPYPYHGYYDGPPRRHYYKKHKRYRRHKYSGDYGKHRWMRHRKWKRHNWRHYYRDR